jgi:hypothetical protein
MYLNPARGQPQQRSDRLFMRTSKGSALATWLKPDERNWLQERLDAERANREMSFSVSWLKSMATPRVLALSAVYFCTVTPFHGLSFSLLRS